MIKYSEVEDPIKSAQSALSADMPDVSKQIDDVYQAVESGKSLGDFYFHYYQYIQCYADTLKLKFTH